MTPDLQQIILDSHNKLRNQQALGQTPGFSPAKRMATMVKLIILKRRFSIIFI